MVKERFFVKLAVEPQVWEKFRVEHNRLGMTQIVAGTRLFDWFMAQSQTVQAAILGNLPDELRASAVEEIKASLIRNLRRPDAASVDPQLKAGTAPKLAGARPRTKGAS